MELLHQCDATSAGLQASSAEFAEHYDCGICERVNLFSDESLCDDVAANVRFGITAEGLYEQLAHGN
jgi:hypothetical protein